MLVIVGYKPCIVIVQKINKLIPQKINYYNGIQKTTTTTKKTKHATDILKAT